MVHETTRHTRDFTVISNRLLQHRHLGGVAIAVGCHMMSVAEGTSVTIRSLHERLGFSRQKIADALHALERYGYLRRTVIRTPGGRLVTETVVCHNPNAQTPEAPTPKPPAPERTPAPTPTPPPTTTTATATATATTPPAPPPATPPAPRTHRPLPPVPHPGFPARELLRAALHVLVTLRDTDPRLHCSEADAAHLTPGVAAWLERGASPETIRHALTTGLPTAPLHRPAALLAHRLATHLPPAPPRVPPPPTPRTPAPLQHCETCDTCFRAPPTTPCPTCDNPDTTPAAYVPAPVDAGSGPLSPGA
ncbi:helix-turn-helix domain-containing protein [Streptomyces hydrogenans]|uniref:helix-turn-helix domain-containing protein n=1 Tax=Streptomyces hydrogenans TaxID=1873719 RepID=UPI003334264F